MSVFETLVVVLALAAQFGATLPCSYKVEYTATAR